MTDPIYHPDDILEMIAALCDLKIATTTRGAHMHDVDLFIEIAEAREVIPSRDGRKSAHRNRTLYRLNVAGMVLSAYLSTEDVWKIEAIFAPTEKEMEESEGDARLERKRDLEREGVA